MPVSLASDLRDITDFESLVAYLREELDWYIPELPTDQLTYSYTADELGLKIDAAVEIKQLRPITGQADPWGVFFVDFDKTELPVTLLRRLLSGVSLKKRASANASERRLFDKNDLLFVSAFGKADDRRIALAHFHQEPESAALPTLRVLEWDRSATGRKRETVRERLDHLRWPYRDALPEARQRWARAFVDRPRDGIKTAKEMAETLALGAKQIRDAIREVLPREKEGEPLPRLFAAVKETLNKNLDIPKFADTYAQTIAYGLLAKRFDQIQRWRKAKAAALNGDLPEPKISVEALESALPTNPFLTELLSSFLEAVGRDAGGARLDFDVLGVGDLIDLLNTANIEAVLDDFDKDKQGDDPVIHFYEGFLAAYDRAMKVQRGVFYTPKPVVSFIVRSVDEVLRTEFGLKDGLADTATWGEFVAEHPEAKIPEGVDADDPFVKILDPATGTGTFLVEVIDLIHNRLWNETWKDEREDEKRRLWNEWVPKHLLPRLYGYELMMAPYAVAHMKIGLKLADTGYDFSGVEVGTDGRERPARARVFLTNALEPARRFSLDLNWNSAIAHEAEAANAAKGESFTVVLGNPPYQGISANMEGWAQRLVDRFRFIDGIALGEKKSWLQNDYVKFFSFCMDAVENVGCGVLSLITDNSYLDGPTFRGLRYQQALRWTQVRVLDLGGKSTIASNTECDQNVFDIQQGVAIQTLVLNVEATPKIRVGRLQGSESFKLRALERSRQDELISGYGYPRADEFDFFSPPISEIESEYRAFASIPTATEFRSVGVQTSRDHLSVGFDQEHLISNLESFSDPIRTDEEVRAEFFSPAKADAKYLAGDTRGWRVSNVRREMAREGSWRQAIAPIAYRPFDNRVFAATELLSDWPRPELLDAVRMPNNVVLNVVRRTENRRAYDYIFVSQSVPGNHLVSLKDGSYGVPLWLPSLATNLPRPNLSRGFITRLADLNGLHFDDGSEASVQEPLPNTEPPPPEQDASPLRREHGDLITSFGSRDVFDWIYAVLHSPEYRTRYADFLKSDFARVPLPKDGAIFAELVPLGTKLVALHLLDPAGAPELVDPKVKFTNAGKAEARLGAWGEKKDVRRDPVSGRVYVNAGCWFATVPEAAWEHWIGGYQPAQKWLKDRSQTGTGAKLKPGRVLSDEDILHYRRMIVALEETGKLMKQVDEVIARHGGWPDAFRGMED